MAPPIHFRKGTFQDTCDDYHDRRNELAAAADKLKGALAGIGGIAGSDDPGKKFSDGFDPQLKDNLEAMTAVINATGSMHDLLQQSAFNYRNSNDVRGIDEQADLAIPSWMSPLHFVPNAPSTYGGENKDPSWWSKIKSYIGGKIYPNGNIDKLSSLGTACRDVSVAFNGVADAVLPTNSKLFGLEVPERAQITTNAQNLEKAIRQVASNFSNLASAADNYSRDIENAHNRLEDEVKTLVMLAAVAVGVGVVVAFVSFGTGAVAGVGGGAAALTAAGALAIEILDALALAAYTTTAAYAGASAIAAVNDIQALAAASPVAAQYNSVNEAAGEGDAYDVAGRRVKLRKGTKEEIDAAQRRDGLVDKDGNLLDPNTLEPIPKNGPFDYGHRPGFEWWRTRIRAREEGWTRQELIEYENDPSHYRIENRGSNRSHQFEQPKE